MRLSGDDRAQLRSRLASEYVLGTLRGGARRRFEHQLATVPGLREQVSDWEARLTPLAERIPAVAPHRRVWEKIQARIETPASKRTLAQNGLKTGSSGGVWNLLSGSLAFWRSLGLGASALCVLLIAGVITGRFAEPAPVMTAVLEDSNDARMVVEQASSGVLLVKMIKPWKPAPNVAKELWVVTKDGTARSLGIINEFTDTRIILTDVEGKLADGAVLALSKEPPGGSPTGKPTGPVICKGMIARMPAKSTNPKPQI